MRTGPEIAEVIKNLARNKGISVSDMLEGCGINKNGLFIMANRGSIPKADNLAKIADVLCCSVDYLLGRTDRVSLAGPGDAELTEAEKKLLSYFRQLDGRGQDSVFSCAVSQLDRLEELNRGTAILETEEHRGNQSNAV